MTDFIQNYLIIYFLLFLLVTVVWRNWVLYRRTGNNALKLANKTGPEAVTSWYFRLIPLLIVFVLIMFSALNQKYYIHLAPFIFLEYDAIKITGMVVMAVALLWIAVSQSQMGESWRIGIDHETKTKIVTNGVFAISRNPIFLGVTVGSIGFFLVLPNAITLVILVLQIVIVQVQISLEEVYLTEKHGEEYTNYCKEVRRWI